MDDAKIFLTMHHDITGSHLPKCTFVLAVIKEEGGRGQKIGPSQQIDAKQNRSLK